MRYLGIGAAIVVAVVAVIIIGVPYLNWEPSLVRSALKRVEDDFQITIRGGPVRVASLVPAIRLQATDIVVAKQQGGVTHRLAEVRSASITLSYGDLVDLFHTRAVHAANITVVEPSITLEHAADGSLILPTVPDRLKAPAGTPVQGGPAGARFRVDRFKVVKGSLIYRPSGKAAPIAANLDMHGALTDWQGSGSIGGNGVLTVGSDAGLSLTIDRLDWRNHGKKFTVNGAIRSQTAVLKIDGEAAMPLSSAQASATVSAQADVAARLFEELSSFTGWQDLSGLLQHQLPLDGSATLRLAPELITVDPVRLKIGGDSASVIASYAGGSTHAVDAKIDVESLDLANWHISPGQSQPQSCSAATPAAPASTSIDVGKLDVNVRSTIKSLTYKAAKATAPATISDVEANLRIRNGVVTVPRFRALLPGSMTVDASTVMTDHDGGKATTGRFAITGRRLNETLAAFGIAAPTSPKHAQVDVGGVIEVAPDRAQLTDLKIAVDDVKGLGSLKLALAEPMVAVGALDLDLLKLDRYLLPEGGALREVKASKVHLDTELAWPSTGGLDCLKIRKVAIEAETLEATRRQPPASANEPTPFGRALIEAGAAAGDFSDDVRRRLAIGGADHGSPIGAAIFDGLEKDLPNLTRALERVDSPEPVRLFAKRIVLRDAPAKTPGNGTATAKAPGNGAATVVDASNVRASINVADIAGRQDHTKRAVFELSASTANIGDFRLQTSDLKTSVDFTLVNGAAKLTEGKIHRLRVTGNAPDYARPEGATGPAQRQNFAVSGHLALTRTEVNGKIEELDIGDLLYAENVIIAIGHPDRQPINVSISSANAAAKLTSSRAQNWPLERPGLQHAPCAVQPAPSNRQFAKFNILILGQAPRRSGVAGRLASADLTAAVAPATRGEPLIHALSLEGTMGDAGTIIDDLSILFGQKSGLSLRWSADGEFDNFGSRRFETSGCVTATVEGTARLPSFGGLLSDKVGSTLRDGTPWSSARLNVAAKNVGFTSAAGTMDSLSILYETFAGAGATADARDLHRPVGFEAKKLKFGTERNATGAETATASIDALEATIGSTRIALAAPAGGRLLSLEHGERAIAGCGAGQAVDAKFDLLTIRPEDALAVTDFKKRLMPLLPRSAADAKSCLAWKLVGKIGAVERLGAVASAATKGVVALGTGSDGGRLSDLHLEVSGDHKGEVRYKLHSDFIAQGAAAPLACKAKTPPSILGIPSIEAGNKDNHVSLRGSTGDGNMAIWDGDVAATVRCVDLRHLWAIYETAVGEVPFVKLTAGTVDRLSFSRTAGSLKSLTGHIDADLSVALELTDGVLRAIARVFRMEDTIRAGLPLTVRLTSKHGKLGGHLSSLEKQLDDPKSDAFKLPYLFRLEPSQEATISKPVEVNVYLQSPKWQTHSLTGPCTAFTLLPSYRQSFDVCWGCESARLLDLKVGEFVLSKRDRERCPNRD